MTQAGLSPAGRVRRPPGGETPRSGAVEPARGPLESRPWLVDGAVAVVYTVPLFIVRSVAAFTGAPGIGAWQVAAVVLSGAALLFRRHYPLAVLAAVSLLTTVLTWSLDGNIDMLAVPIALYAVAVYRSPRQAWLAAAAAFAVGFAGLQLWVPSLDAVVRQTGENYNEWNLLVIFALCLIVAVLLGTFSSIRTERMHALVERAEQLAREQDSRAQLAALAERSRIAREMHDIVAHSLSVMVALADGAAATADRDPDRTRDALNQLADTGRSALGDMRALLSVLREDEGVTEGLQPAPGSRDLSVLIDRFRAAGLPIRYSVTGIPPAHPARELTIYRIIQEALTNVLRYADSPSTVEVAIDYAPAETLLAVSDNGRRGPSNRPSEGAGRGIIGMGERAALHGGRASSGPLPDGGWAVRAVLPVTGEES